jgi:hypothetical protein
VPVQRLFIIAPPVARLIRKERGGERVIEGYFPDQLHRSTYVQIEEGQASLILEIGGEEASEERADLPRAHAEALLAVSQSQVEYLRTRLSIGSHEIQLLHFVRPSPLNLVAVAGTSGDKQDRPSLAWFGPEVSADPAYRRRRVALEGAPAVSEAELTNAALNSLLDLLEDQVTTWTKPGQPAESDAPAADLSARSEPTVPVPETEPDEEINDLGIEDAVIRELASSLQPRRG